MTSLIARAATEPNVRGTVWETEVYVEVRWPWLAFIGAQVFMSIICLMLVIGETVRANMDVVKSSTIAALFTISAQEKDDVTRRLLEAEGGSIVSSGEDRRLVPLSIAGKLRRRGSKWALGDA